MTDTSAPAVPTPRWKIVLLAAVVAWVLGLRFWFDLTVTPMGDEAYYWMWGQHLSWSYLDHPPLDGWLQGLVAALFGWSNLSVRLLTWLTLAGTFVLFWLWAKRLAPQDPAGWFWHSAAIYLTIPIISIFTGVAFHDHLLIFFCLASIYCIDTFGRSWEAGAPRWRWLYLSAAMLGLAVLSKYNGVFLGLGYFVWIVARPSLRPLLRSPHLWLALLLAVAMQAPVIGWNLAEGWASLRFHFAERPNAQFAWPNPRRVVIFLGTMIVAMSPVLFASLFRIRSLRSADTNQPNALGLALSTFLTSTVLWAIIAAFAVVYFHWNMVAYIALVPVAYRLIGSGLALWLHTALGLVVVTGAVLNYALTPLDAGGFSDPAAGAAYGWPELGARVAELQHQYPGSFLGASRYTYAAQLGFVLHDADVGAFNPLRSQNDYWWDATAHAGKDAIILADARFPIANAQGQFQSVEKLEDVPVVRFGKTLWTFEIWLGKSYAGH